MKEKNDQKVGRKKRKLRKLDFLKENAAENILQGGYQVCSDTMLGNMASMEGKREI